MNSQRNNKVSVIGLGQMGIKIARLFIDRNFEVTVWNRTKAKALEVKGAEIAETALEAVAASGIIIICVYDNKAVREIFNDITDKSIFSSSVFINFTTGTPQEVNDIEKFFGAAGAAYINGALQVAPDQMGLSETTILLAGNETAYDAVKSTISVLGGNLQYLDNKAAASSAMDLATLSWLYGSYVGMLYGAVLVKQAGLNLNVYGNLLSEVTPGFTEFFKYEIDTIQKDDFRITQSPLSISITATERIADAVRSAGALPEFHDSIALLLKKANNSGLANQELSALIKVINNAAVSSPLQG